MVVRGVAVGLLAAAACCPPPDPVEPSSPSPPHVPATVMKRAQAIPPAVVGRFEAPRSRPSLEPIERDTMKEPPLVPPALPKTESIPPREVLEPRVPPMHADTLPDEVVMRLLETGRAAFTRCFKKAIDADPTVLSFKVRVHVELDAAGAITSATSDATDTALGACLTRAMRWLTFPATGGMAVVDVPLIYRAD
jgi:hypothetical protein